MNGDRMKCNFGSKHPFRFELASHILKLQFSEQFAQVKELPVKLETIYGLVKSYLASMAYAQTLNLVDAEYGADLVTDLKSEEETRLVQRKMTIDYGSLAEPVKAPNDAKKLNQIGISQDQDEEVGSQLTVETEQMVQLAAADITTVSASLLSSQKVIPQDIMLGNEEKIIAAEYVDSLFAD